MGNTPDEYGPDCIPLDMDHMNTFYNQVFDRIKSNVVQETTGLLERIFTATSKRYYDEERHQDKYRSVFSQRMFVDKIMDLLLYAMENCRNPYTEHDSLIQSAAKLLNLVGIYPRVIHELLSNKEYCCRRYMTSIILERIGENISGWYSYMTHAKPKEVDKSKEKENTLADTSKIEELLAKLLDEQIATRDAIRSLDISVGNLR